MADLIFYTNPLSRGQTVRWMLEEVGAAVRDRDPRLCDDDEGRALSVDQSDGQGPGDRPQGQGRDRSRGDLLLSRRRLSRGEPRAAAGRPRRLLPLDLLHLGPGRGGVQQQGGGLGADARAAAHVRLRQLRPRHRHARKGARPASEYIAADHFTAADLFVGANINFMLAFNLLEPTAGVRRLCRGA